MKKIIITLFICIPFLLNSQKIEHDKKTNQVTIDGKDDFLLIRKGCVFDEECYFEAYDRDSIKVMRINYRDFNSTSEISKSNPDGTVRYFEYIFLESKQKTEIDFYAMSPKSIAKTIVTNKLIVNGKLDQKAVDEFVLVNGTPFKDRVKR